MSPYCSKDKIAERKSSFCASLSCVCVAALLCLGLVSAQPRPSAVFSAERGKPPLILRLASPPESRPLPEKDKRYRLLSQIKTPDNPIIPEYRPEPPKPKPEPSKPEREPLPEKPAPPRKNRPAARQPVKQAPPGVTGDPLMGDPAGDPAGDPEGDPAGVRGGTAGGTAGGQGGQSGAPGREHKVLAELLRAVEARKHYPKQARRIGAEGLTVLRVNIEHGRIQSCSLDQDSGNETLDRATRQLGDRLTGLELISAGGGKPLAVLVPVRYQLR